MPDEERTSMFTVALIGADGAGKTTIGQLLAAHFPVPVKYLYMGANIESSNAALPTSRLILFIKLWRYKRIAKRSGIIDPGFVSTHHKAHRSVKYGRIGATLRLLNRLAEGWFRQLISWVYQLRGFIVIYDRHFLFDAASANPEGQRFIDRVYYWLLTHLYPQPDLVIFLDASPEILYARKGEATLESLQKRREAYIAQGKKTANFIRVDAAQPIDQVIAEVSGQIMTFHSTSNLPKVNRT
jgi:thymidylate kinase